MDGCKSGRGGLIAATFIIVSVNICIFSLKKLPHSRNLSYKYRGCDYKNINSHTYTDRRTCQSELD